MSPISRIAALLSRIPFKTLLVIVPLCYVKVERRASGVEVSFDARAEFYPLSSLPMFSTFSRAANYVYLADATGAPLRPGEFNTSTGSLTKSYRKYLNRIKKPLGLRLAELTNAQRRLAGDRVLRNLRESVAVEAIGERAEAGLRLYEVTLTRGADGKIARHEELVGEMGETAREGAQP